MADHTKIEWTEATWNPVTGCTKVSQGCKHCYAERDWCRMQHLPAYAGRAFTDVDVHYDRLAQPVHWKRPRFIFVNSMSDLFHEAVPNIFIDDVFGVMAACERHTFQILTKRPARMREYLREDRRHHWADAVARRFGGSDPDALHDAIHYGERALPNVWIGVSVEDQTAADERIPLLLQTPAAVRWISAEPLLGPVDLTQFIVRSFDEAVAAEHYGLDWVVAGGESGQKARPMHPDWAYSVMEQCAAAHVPFLFKQWGEWVSAGQPAFGTVKGEVQHIRSDGSFWGDDLTDDENADVLTVVKVGKKAAGRLLGGVVHNGYPKPAVPVSLTGNSAAGNFVKEGGVK